MEYFSKVMEYFLKLVESSEYLRTDVLQAAFFTVRLS